jgi:hypothetical protein
MVLGGQEEVELYPDHDLPGHLVNIQEADLSSLVPPEAVRE